MYTIHDLATLSGLNYWVVYHAVVCGRLPEPTHRMATTGGRRRYYSKDDLTQLLPMLKEEARLRAQKDTVGTR